MKARLFGVLLLCGLSGLVEADVSNPNPNATISIVGDSAFTLTAPGAVTPTTFSVRVVDAHGNPLEGLTIQFAAAVQVCDPMFDPGCIQVEQELYGSFANGSLVDNVLTDSNGVATSSLFIGNEMAGMYTVDAALENSLSDANAAVLKGLGDPYAYFSINQSFTTTPFAIQPGITGAWYDPQLSGQGFNIEILPNNQILAFFYGFDPKGNNVFLSGIGSIDVTDPSSASIPLNTTTGGFFPPDLISADITRAAWGELFFRFIDCNHGYASWSVDGGQAAGYTNGMIPIVRITSVATLGCN